uniref:DUF1918 domain-containing protein n=1 Tax=viral metagenome TaxID=1070528 RepID=A0A6H1ZYJ9_9ZZZZ
MISNTELKVGDKVKYIGASCPKYKDYVGSIIEVKEPGRKFPYMVCFENGSWYPVLRPEIERVHKTGEQLMFSFMK